MTLAESVGEALGVGVARTRSVSGGDINRACALTLADGRELFVKYRADVAPGEFATEAAGLRWLGDAPALPVPAVVAVGDPPESEPGPGWLALEWIDVGALDAVGERKLGAGLARLHAAGAASFGAGPPDAPSGPAGSLRIGPLRFERDELPDWATYYAERLVRPVLRRARDAGALPPAASVDVERLCDRTADLAGPPEPVARLHGDLWSGNVMAGRDGQPLLVDPAAYGGHREVDLAMLALFGSPAAVERVRAGYIEVSPLADGHEERVALWQLFPLLVHAALFGGGYGQSAHAVARRYVG